MLHRSDLRALVFAASALLGLGAGAAHSAELKLISSVALKGVIERVVPDFERASGVRVTIGELFHGQSA